MSLVRRLFSKSYRSARKAEGEGRYREAAALYVQVEATDEAANALLFHAARTTDFEERVNSYKDALRWMEADDPRRAEVFAQIGLATLDDAQRRGVRTSEERRRLLEAAEMLEDGERNSEAALAYELLEMVDETARCLEKAGEVEKLEALLAATGEEAGRQRTIKTHISAYEMAESVGARREAKDALEAALKLAPEDAAIADLLRHVESKWLSRGRAELVVDGQTLVFVFRLPVTLGREGDLVVRGTSVSRQHTDIDRDEGQLVVRDRGSRNGTLVRGLPIASTMTFEGATEIGLGDDVAVAVEPEGEGVRFEVRQGLDRGTIAYAGAGPFQIPGAAAVLTLERGLAVLTADKGTDTRLNRGRCAAPIELLKGDRIEIDGVVVEVRG